MRFLYTFLILFLLLPIAGRGQSIYNIYSSDSGLYQSSAGGSLFTGPTTKLKDKGFLLISQTHPFTIVRTDSSGRPLWMRVLSVPPYDTSTLDIGDVKELPSGKLLLIGNMGKAPQNPGDIPGYGIGIICLDRNGNLLWSRHTHTKYARAFQASNYTSLNVSWLPDKSGLAFGLSDQTQDALATVLEIDTLGTMIRSFAYTSASATPHYVCSLVRQVGNRRFLYFGSTDYSDSSLVMAEVAPSGAVLRSKKAPYCGQTFKLCDLKGGGVFLGTSFWPNRQDWLQVMCRISGDLDKVYTYNLYSVSGARRIPVRFSLSSAPDGVHLFNGYGPGSVGWLQRVAFIDTTGKVRGAAILQRENTGLFGLTAQVTFPSFVLMDYYRPANTMAPNLQPVDEIRSTFMQGSYTAPVGCSFVHDSIVAELDSIPTLPGDIRQAVSTHTWEDFEVTIRNLADMNVLEACQKTFAYLGLDQQICQAGTRTLHAPVLQSGQRVVWSTGRIGSGADSVTVPTPGRYWVRVETTSGIFSDTLTVTLDSSRAYIRANVRASCPQGRLNFGHAEVPAGSQLSWFVNTVPHRAGRDSLLLTPTNPTNRDSVLTIQLQVRSTSGCRSSDTVRVTLWPGYPNFLGPDFSACRADTVLVVPSFARGSDLLWHKPDGTTVFGDYLPINESGMYRASFTAKGCTYQDSVLVGRRLPAVIPISLRFEGRSVDADADTLTITDQGELLAFPTRVASAVVWLPTSAVDTLRIQVQEETQLSLRMAYQDPATGCTDTSARLLYVLPAITLPNVVTPDGDKLNDWFTSTRPLPEGRLQVFTRWGRQVYVQDPYRGQWPEGSTLPGSYFYRLEPKVGRALQGWVEVVR